MSNKDYNNHLVNALPASERELREFGGRCEYIIVDGQAVSFKIQSGPVKENGRNGCDATDIIRYTIGLYRSFNGSHSCKENSCTITKLEEALHWQEARTRDREHREVEGKDID